VSSTHAVNFLNSLHRSRHQPGSLHPHRSAPCHPDDHGQASEILRPHRPFGFRWGPHAGPQRWHRRPKDWRRPRGRPRQTWLCTTWNRRTWVCGLSGTEHMIVNCGVKSWKRQRSCRGTLHGDDKRQSNNAVSVQPDCSRRLCCLRVMLPVCGATVRMTTYLVARCSSSKQSVCSAALLVSGYTTCLTFHSLPD